MDSWGVKKHISIYASTAQGGSTYANGVMLFVVMVVPLKLNKVGVGRKG